MSSKQRIDIDFDWAVLTISSDFNNEIYGELDNDNVKIKTLTFSSVKDGSNLLDNNNLKVIFSNIIKSDELNNYVPIQFIESNNFVNLYFLEETEYTLIFELKSDKTIFKPDLLFNELITHKPEFFSMDIVKDNIYVIKLNFRSHVGKTAIDIFFEDFKFNLPIEVRSRKIDYESDYPLMISDLVKYSSSLFFDYDASLFHNYDNYDKKRETKYEDYMMLEYIFQENNLPSVFEYLSKNLYSNLTTFNEEVPINFAYNISDNELINIVSKPDNIVEVDENNFLFRFKEKTFSPISVNEVRYEDNIDVQENRFFKYFLEYVKYLILNLKNDDELVGYIESRINIFESKINYFLSQHFFSEISKMRYVPFNSQVLQKKEGYRDILEYYLMLDVAFKINCDLITNEIKGFEKRLSQIYEYWCFFKLYELIIDLTDSKNTFNNFVDDNWTLSIKSGFINDFNCFYVGEKEIKLSLAFKQEFTSNNELYRSYSLKMEPDFTVSIEYGCYNYFIHFDAKYRVEKGEPKSDDIQKMHTYKDSIENSIASFVLFPGNLGYQNQFNEFGNPMMSVGAFSLNPSNSQQEIENIKNYLMLIIDEITAD